METQLTETPASDFSLIQGYNKNLSYDEMLDPKGVVQPHWKALCNNLESLGDEELHERQEAILWYLKENGVTYHVYNDPLGHKRTWRLNAVPLVIDEVEWQKIEQGLRQRAEILNKIHADLYGPRELIKNKIIPPHILYAHRGFLRPCDGISYAGRRALQFYAADMARGPDGQMWIINDRTQAPSGMGYALENRLTLSSVIPELFENNHVRKLRGFFSDYKAMLHHSAPNNNLNPSIVVLTPGPHNETYFEHTYLASYLGYPLVQGNDLVARDGYLWLKSLQGLKQVDVVLRRVDDDYCDPLELREDSYLGVAGLLDVVRKGNVSIVNPVGTGVLENPGLIPFMSHIAKYFLDEELLLPQIATWWCGQKSEMVYVLEHLDSLVIKQIDRSEREHSIIGNALSEEQKANLIAKIKAKPHLFVGQEQVSFSTVPTLTEEGLEARNSSWRAFLCAHGEGYSVMPGGLVRVAPGKDTLFVSNQKGGDSKDIWILGAEEDSQLRIPNIIESSPLQAGSLADLPSLMAENLFWVGRYTGRALWSARYIRTVIRLILGVHYHEQQTNDETIRQLCMGLTHLTMTYPGFFAQESEAMLKNPRKEILSVLLDGDRVGSLTNVLLNLSSANDAVSNLWPMDAWRVFDGMMKSWGDLKFDSIRSLRKVVQALDQLITRIMAHTGLVQESILLEQGQLLYMIGLRMEECILSASKVRSLMVFTQEKQVEYELMEALLNSHESLNTYRYIYRSYLKVENVLTLLLLDDNYPRSLVRKLHEIDAYLARMPQPIMDVQGEHQLLVRQTGNLLVNANIQELVNTEGGEMRSGLENLLASTFDGLSHISDSLTKTYFSHSYDQPAPMQTQMQTQSQSQSQSQ